MSILRFNIFLFFAQSMRRAMIAIFQAIISAIITKIQPVVTMAIVASALQMPFIARTDFPLLRVWTVVKVRETLVNLLVLKSNSFFRYIIPLSLYLSELFIFLLLYSLL